MFYRPKVNRYRGTTINIFQSWFKLSYLVGSVDKGVAINLAKFTMMALTSAVCVPLSHMLIRDHLGETFGWSIAGYWEAMWRLSTAYLVLVTTTLSLYYLPRLSEIKEQKALKSEIVNGYKFILPLAVVAGLLMYLFRDIIVSLLFSDDFSPMRALFAWQRPSWA